MSAKFTIKQLSEIIEQEINSLLLEVNPKAIRILLKSITSSSITLGAKINAIAKGVAQNADLLNITTLTKTLNSTAAGALPAVIKSHRGALTLMRKRIQALIDEAAEAEKVAKGSSGASTNTINGLKAIQRVIDDCLVVLDKAAETTKKVTPTPITKAAKPASKYKNLYRAAGLVGAAGLAAYLMGLFDDPSPAAAKPVNCMKKAAAYLGVPEAKFVKDIADPNKGPGLFAILDGTVKNPSIVGPQPPFDKTCLKVIQKLLTSAPGPQPQPSPSGSPYAGQQQGQFGRCRTYAVMVTKGPNNMAKAFIKDMKHLQRTLVELGYNLGTFGPTGDGVDGKYGGSNSMTRKAVQALQKSVGLRGRKADGVWGNVTSTAIEVSVKKTQSNKIYDAIKKTLVGPPSKCAGTQTGDQTGGQTSGFGNVDTTQAVRAYMFVWNTINGRVKEYLRIKGVKNLVNRKSRTLQEPFLSELRAFGAMGNYRIDNKSYSTGNPKLGQLLMTKLQALKSQATATEKALGFDQLPPTSSGADTQSIVRIVDKATNEFLKRVLQENKSYNFNFSKYSKLWD